MSLANLSTPSAWFTAAAVMMATRGQGVVFQLVSQLVTLLMLGVLVFLPVASRKPFTKMPAFSCRIKPPLSQTLPVTTLVTGGSTGGSTGGVPGSLTLSV